MKVSIIGTGYVGIVSGACLAEKGCDIICVDVDADKVDKINKGISPIYENNLQELIQKNVVNGRMRATTNIVHSIHGSDVSIIAVGTPFDGQRINLEQIRHAAEDIGKSLREKEEYHVVIVKSTVVPGTTDEFILPILEKNSGKSAGSDFGLGMNPEFLREGRAVFDFMNPDRIVIGGMDKRTTDRVAELYCAFKGVEIMITNNRTAEMIKYASNCLLATLISFSNEIANICSLTPGIDVKEVMEGVHLDKRFNPILHSGERANPEFLSYLQAGCGFGGSCFPKDIKAIISYAKSKGEVPKLLESVIEINDTQPYRLIQLIQNHFKTLDGIVVAVLGLAFKPGTDDLRESPAIAIINSLVSKVAYIKAYDPIAKENAKRILGTDKIEFPDSMADAVQNADVIIIITKWDEFEELINYVKYMEHQPLIIDGRRMLNKGDFKDYLGIGLYPYLSKAI